MAKANIRQAMTMLDPEECARVYELPNIMARETFRLDRIQVNTFDELIALCSRYYVHHWRRVICDGVTPPIEHVHGALWDIIDHGFSGGREAAFKAAQRGLNGGLPAVLDAIRDHFLKEQEKQYFDHVLMEAVDVMDLEDIESLMRQYLERYGRHMDGENLQSARFLVPKYREVIRAHSQIVRNIRTHFGR